MSKTGNYFCVIYSFKFRKKYDNLFKNKFRGEIEMNKLQLNSKKIIRNSRKLIPTTSLIN